MMRMPITTLRQITIDARDAKRAGIRRIKPVAQSR